METPPPDPRIERVRALYVDTDIPIRIISQRVGVPMTTLKRWINDFGWPRRGSRRFGHPAPPATAAPDAASPPVTRTVKRRKRPTVESLVDRLYSIITHNLESMESRMSDDQPTTNDNPERDARAIGNLVRSVEKLKELEPEHSKRDARTVGSSRYPLSPGEEEKLRDEIVDRLLRLRERFRNPRPD